MRFRGGLGLFGSVRRFACGLGRTSCSHSVTRTTAAEEVEGMAARGRPSGAWWRRGCLRARACVPSAAESPFRSAAESPFWLSVRCGVPVLVVAIEPKDDSGAPAIPGGAEGRRSRPGQTAGAARWAISRTRPRRHGWYRKHQRPLRAGRPADRTGRVANNPLEATTWVLGDGLPTLPGALFADGNEKSVRRTVPYSGSGTQRGLRRLPVHRLHVGPCHAAQLAGTSRSGALSVAWASVAPMSRAARFSGSCRRCARVVV